MENWRIIRELLNQVYMSPKGQMDPCNLMNCVCKKLARRTGFVEEYPPRKWTYIGRLKIDVVAIQGQYVVEVVSRSGDPEEICRESGEISRIGDIWASRKSIRDIGETRNRP